VEIHEIVRGAFDWHTHDADEFFLVLHGAGMVRYQANCKVS
jgi:hypothetical protein